mmetsp:Transcript_25024/g.87246  ORF Transcript_25024/g.87246 Transcript_25024/m.87246 type:complete len:284 (-) Transcript_25024:1464-2315(-)
MGRREGNEQEGPCGRQVANLRSIRQHADQILDVHGTGRNDDDVVGTQRSCSVHHLVACGNRSDLDQRRWRHESAGAVGRESDLHAAIVRVDLIAGDFCSLANVSPDLDRAGSLIGKDDRVTAAEPFVVCAERNWRAHPMHEVPHSGGSCARRRGTRSLRCGTASSSSPLSLLVCSRACTLLFAPLGQLHHHLALACVELLRFCVLGRNRVAHQVLPSNVRRGPVRKLDEDRRRVRLTRHDLRGLVKVGRHWAHVDAAARDDLHPVVGLEIARAVRAALNLRLG